MGEEGLPDVTVVVPDAPPQPPTLPTVHITALGEGCLHSGKVSGLASLEEAFLQPHHGHHWAELPRKAAAVADSLPSPEPLRPGRYLLARTPAGGLDPVIQAGPARVPASGWPGDAWK